MTHKKPTMRYQDTQNVFEMSCYLYIFPWDQVGRLQLCSFSSPHPSKSNFQDLLSLNRSTRVLSILSTHQSIVHTAFSPHQLVKSENDHVTKYTRCIYVITGKYELDQCKGMLHVNNAHCFFLEVVVKVEWIHLPVTWYTATYPLSWNARTLPELWTIPGSLRATSCWSFFDLTTWWGPTISFGLCDAWDGNMLNPL